MDRRVLCVNKPDRHCRHEHITHLGGGSGVVRDDHRRMLSAERSVSAGLRAPQAMLVVRDAGVNLSSVRELGV
jgi:hypothetical protein